MAGTLYLVRHGRTLFNEKRIIQGWSDSPLTAEGEAQAERVGRYFAREGIAFDHAYASTLARTHQTIERITDMPYAREPGLREWFFGSFEGEHVYLMPPYPWGDFYVQFGGEGQEGFRARVAGALTDIMQRPGHERVLAVSHGSASREFLLAALGEGLGAEHPVPGNCSVARYGFDGERFHLEEGIEQEDMARALGE